MKHRSGFVNIIGKPNAGKSTLMNALVGEKLAIITHKAQTTRHRIMGVVSGKDFQIVYSDTPGILDPKYKLHEAMMEYVETAFEDADVLVFILDITDSKVNETIVEKVRQSGKPVLLVINKIDLSNEEVLNREFDRWNKLLPGSEIIPVSAKLGFNIDTLIKVIRSKLPESPPFYEKDTLTDKTERFFASEIIREKIFLNYSKEIPYSAEVVIEVFKREPKMMLIKAVIFVMRESQKAIMLGHQGNAIKKVNTQARKDLEKWLGHKVFLEVTIKVKKDWRDDEGALRRLGYE
jgi:GTP-binding protein Era